MNLQKQREALTRYCNTWRDALKTWKPGTAWEDPVADDDLARDGLD